MSESQGSTTWKRCGVCKHELGFEAEYYECSVSTCNGGRNHPVFCSVSCWEQHVPVLRHRDAWAEQKRSPSHAQWEAGQAAASGAGAAPPAPRRIVVAASAAPRKPDAGVPEDILVVASKLKAYVRARAGMNTSEAVMEELSHLVRGHADRAIERARADGRKTVMDRDFRDE